MKNLDLLLVNPNNKKHMYGNLGFSLSAIEPPLWTGLIAGFIRRRGFSVKIIDAEAESWTPEDVAERVIEFNPLLVGISAIGANPSASSTPKMAVIRDVLNLLKNRIPHIKTFLYGIHPSALPERTLKEEAVDFVCRGECFYTVFELLKILKSDKKVKDCRIDGLWYRNADKIESGGWGKLVQDLDELPFVAWELLPMEKYKAHNWHCFEHINQRKPYAVIYTSLGCPFNCTYCNIRTLYNGKPGIRFRSPEKVVEEIDFLVKNYRVKNIKIMDEIFVLKESRVIAFCDLIIQRGYDLNMWAYARVDTVNKKILKKMKQAGINWLAFGIEAGNKKVRDDVAKGKFDKDVIKKSVEITHASGIYIVANFIFGLPEDDFETMQETLNMAEELNCEYVNFYTTMAYPGSQLYKDAAREGVKLPDAWLGYAQFSDETLPLPSKYLSSAEVLRFRDRAFDKYHSRPEYLKMIKGKFGLKAVEHIKEMLKHKIYRKFA